MSQLTTHVLDTSTGKPAGGIDVLLEQVSSGSWNKVASGRTDANGRISDLLPSQTTLAPGDYRLVFETAAYFKHKNTKSFYPKITIEFSITDDTHYHVPLLLNPFGYSTYRGS
jgi:hydroxyisourate hydrolase